MLLALLMALSLPVTVLADGADANFSLATDTTDFYAGMSYELTAKITDLSFADYNAAPSFTWSVDNASAAVNSKNNYTAKSNGNGTYTVTETASFDMPQSGESVTVTATLGSRTKSVKFVSKTPIQSYTPVFNNNAHAYYDENSNTLYLDREAEKNPTEYATFSFGSVAPAVHDDQVAVSVGGFAGGKYTLTQLSTYGFRLALDSAATGKGTVNFITLSGSLPTSVNLQTCVPLEKYSLAVQNYGDSTSTFLVENKDGEEANALVSAIAGKPFSIVRYSAAPTASNDYLEYTLYTNAALTNPASGKYYSYENNGCDLNIDVPGTYYLVCHNRSMDNAQLDRSSLADTVIQVVVSKAYPIQNISIVTLDNLGNKTDVPLENITLYTNTAATYALANHVLVNPTANTDTLVYSPADTSVAKVDAQTGVITAVAPGTTTVWVRSSDNKEAVASVNVEVRVGVKAISNIVTEDGTVNIPSGHVKKMVATTNPATVDEPIYWSTSNPDVLSIHPTTGVVLAKDVTEKTPVIVYATTESGISNNTPVYVVPSNKAQTLTLRVTSDSATFSEDTSTGYTVYSDYYLTKNQKSFHITAEALGANGSETNDELVWSVTYAGGVGMTFEEAKEAGYLNYKKHTNASYTVTPLKSEVFTVTCTATTNITAPSEQDATDTVLLKLRQTASTISVVNENTGKTAGTTIYIPIGGSVDITVKTSTASTNSHTEDPATYKVLSGGEYVSVAEKDSADGEGKTYTITGLAFGMEATKITFASASQSKSSTINFYVRNNLNDATVTGVPASVNYTGSAITFSDLAVYMGGSTVDKSLYTVKYSDNTNVGTGVITLTGSSGTDKSYAGSVRVMTFEIQPLSVATATVSAIADQKLSAKVRSATPRPTVTVNGRRLTLDKDYTLKYTNNTKAGTATVTVTGIGNYTGTARKTFKVIDIAEYFSIASIATQTYTSKALAPAPKVTYLGKTLTKGTDYTVTYKNNINTGTATVTVTGTGFYAGTKTATFTIKPKAGNIISLKAGKKSFTVKWSKQKDITGYQIQYATDKKFTKNKKTAKETNLAVNSKTVKKLTAKKTYYVRVRTYKTVGSTTIYGAWSKVKSVKTKK